MYIRAAVAALFLAAALLASASQAQDYAIPSRVFLNREGKVTKGVYKPSDGIQTPAGWDPNTGPLTVTIDRTPIPFPGGPFEPVIPPGDIIPKPPEWPPLPGDKFVIKAKTETGLVVIKSNGIKLRFKGTSIPLLAEGEDASVVIEIGTTRYCALCGGETKGDPTKLTKRVDCSAPVACPPASPSGAFLD